MSRRVDLTGQRFGRLVVVGFAYMSKCRHSVWNCRCDCGRTTTVFSNNLTRGKATSCGCLTQERIDAVSIGQRFGRLTVLSRVDHPKSSSVHWLCSCECGNHVEVKAHDLTSGHTRSCGCFQIDMAHESNFKHGLSQSKLYNVWSSMISRTSTPSCTGYENYGGRGITVCEEWKNDFQTFYDWAMSHGYQEGLTIDRIDVNGNYCPENCRWATRKEQALNKRNTPRIEYGGQSMTITEAAERYHILRSTFAGRLKRGWTVQEAIELPLHAHRKKKK